MRCVPGSINVPVSKLPHTPGLTIDKPEKVAQSFIDSLNEALQQNNHNVIPTLFSEDGIWRDHLALSWEFQTVYQKDILSFLQNCQLAKGDASLIKFALDETSTVGAPALHALNAEGTATCLQFFVKVETAIGSGKGVVRLIPIDGSWKAYALYTSLRELKNHPEAINGHRPQGAEHGANSSRKNWSERRQDEVDWVDGAEPTVLILGMFRASVSGRSD
jgi:hypothetical protein